LRNSAERTAAALVHLQPSTREIAGDHSYPVSTAGDEP
jgi:hypothetical protein